MFVFGRLVVHVVDHTSIITPQKFGTSARASAATVPPLVDNSHTGEGKEHREHQLQKFGTSTRASAATVPPLVDNSHAGDGQELREHQPRGNVAHQYHRPRQHITATTPCLRRRDLVIFWGASTNATTACICRHGLASFSFRYQYHGYHGVYGGGHLTLSQEDDTIATPSLPLLSSIIKGQNKTRATKAKMMHSMVQ
ncbi:hypothetical protein B0H13DRAFT_1862817 [Mycena leptocephala]|nr:hypothetical protein B0H13DRAFT_1862817 [Mycena leptocephala]